MAPPRKTVALLRARKRKLQRNSKPVVRKPNASSRSEGLDDLDKAARSALMARVQRSGTAPELIARSVAIKLGYRFPLNANDLPGKPDIVFPRLRALIFVHGCFWHRHDGCGRSSTP